MLARISELTGGESLKLNQQLIEQNALVGAQIAVEYSRLGKGLKTSSPLPSSSNPSSSNSKTGKNSYQSTGERSSHFETTNQSTASDHFKPNPSTGQSSLIPVGHLGCTKTRVFDKPKKAPTSTQLSHSATQFVQFFLLGGHRWFYLRHCYEGTFKLCSGKCFSFSFLL